MQTYGDISLYFHIPFCKKKCPYCHFYSIYPTPQNIDLFLEGILIELKRLNLKKNITSIFFGGGTPSLLDPNQIKIILDEIKYKDNCEITLEANPEDISLKKVKKLKNIGINRISIGVQSFDDDSLKTLQRRHTSKDTIQSIEKSYEAGIKNISIDLLYGIPHQSIKSFEKSLKIACNLPITHISLYNLTFEKNTFFYKKRKILKNFLPSEKDVIKFIKTSKKILKTHNFHQYEIASYAKKNFQSKHNIGYWTARQFLGLGPSAFSYTKGKRFKNISNLLKYTNLLKKSFSVIDFEEKLKYPKNVKELLVINLRLLSGINLKKFQKKIGIIPKETFCLIENFIKDKFLQKKNNKIKLTSKGILFYDSIAELLI
ncbi:MAG: hypothetical protein AMS24_04165 [Chlamydiae bacterium SM23_39]|nr:MAG: hypothetical protein AMS24_04165 [Chlamydiae bacterium SM23_39]